MRNCDMMFVHFSSEFSMLLNVCVACGYTFFLVILLLFFILGFTLYSMCTMCTMSIINK